MMTDNGTIQARELRECIVGPPNQIGKSLVEFVQSGTTLQRERFDIYNHGESSKAITRYLKHIGTKPTEKEVAIWMNRIQKFATTDVATTMQDNLAIVRASDIASLEPTSLDPPVIHKLLRFSETANINAATKAGKSWLALEIATAVATGQRCLDSFYTHQAPVLVVDNELKPSTLENRIRRVTTHKQISLDELELDWVSLRGKGWNLIQLGEYLIKSIEPGKYGLIILDAFYRFLPHGFSENDNAQMMELYNMMDEFAETSKSAFLIVHHTSKGNQSGKRVTDLGSGAGSMSRAADTHIAIRDHATEGLAVFEARCRSFAPIDPISIRFDFPCWYLDDAEPQLMQPKSQASEKAKQAEQDLATNIVNTFGLDEFTANDVRARLGVNRDKVTRILNADAKFEPSGWRQPKRSNCDKQQLFKCL